MNDEIKKALEEINILGNTILNDTTYKPTINRREVLYNYITNLQENNDNQMKYIADLLVQITNLQQEINKLTAESTEWEERTYCWQDRAENLEIIIDKAIKYIRELQCNAPEEEALNKLLEIIEGEKNENV